MRVNLLDEKKVRREIRWDQIFIVLLVIFLVVLPLGHYFLNHLEIQSLEREKRALEDQLEVLEPQLERYRELERQIAQFQLPEEIEVVRYRLAGPMRELGIILPDMITLEQLNYEDGEITLEGYTQNIDILLNMVQNVFDSEYYDIISLERFDRDDFIEFNIQVSLETREEMP